MTNTLFTFMVSFMYFATSGPCLASVASMRWKIFHPFFERSGLVADAEMIGRPAESNFGSTAFDSPEKAGPTMPIRSRDSPSHR